MPPFAPVNRARVAVEVAEAVRDVILAGSLQPGDALPPERDLAEQFGVNRSSVREAIHRLEAWGLIEVRHGAGSRVTDFLTTAGLSLLPWLVAPGGRPDPALLGDLLELRVALLGFTTDLAARRAGTVDIAALEEAIEALRAADTIDAVQEADFAFFEALVVATGNRVLGLLVSAIGQVYRHNRALFDPSRHEAALAAVRARDPDAARDAILAYAREALAGPAGCA